MSGARIKRYIADKIMITLLVLFMVALPAICHSGVPQKMNYQGYLTDSGSNPITGTKSILFSIYNVSSGGTALWSETQPAVAVTDGVYSVVLGSVTPINLPFDAQYYLGINVESDGEMTPRLPLSSVGYAFRAVEADNAGFADDADLLDGNDSSYYTNASNFSSGTVDEAIIDAAIARDSEIITNVLANDGYGSTLDSDLLDGNDSAYYTNASNLSSGTVVETLIDSTIARDSEIMPTVLANDGSTSTLDADLLDGQDSLYYLDPGNFIAPVDWADISGYPTYLDDGPFWNLAGNSGTSSGTDFIGTTDSQALEFKVNSERAFRLEPASTPNVIGGYNANSVTSGAVGATIGGGGSASTNTVTDDFGTVGGGENNQAGDNAGTTSDKSYATVSGGVNNNATGTSSSVGGGVNNNATGNASAIAGGDSNTSTGYGAYVGAGTVNTAGNDYASVGGGSNNTASGNYAAVSGGSGNQATGDRTAIGGGSINIASNTYATVPGGYDNEANGQYSLAAGRNAKANHNGAFVWADSTGTDYASTADDEFRVRAAGGMHVDGDLTVATTKAFTADKVTYTSARTHYLSVPGEAFVSRYSASETYVNNAGTGGAYISSAGAGALIAQVHLPHGATITNFEVFFDDDSVDGNIVDVDLYALSYTGSAYTSSATVSSTKTDGYYSLADTSIGGINPVNNTQYGYFIKAYSASWTGGGFTRIMGAVITYTISEAP